MKTQRTPKEILRDIKHAQSSDEYKALNKEYDEASARCVVCGTLDDCYPDNKIRGKQYCDKHYRANETKF